MDSGSFRRNVFFVTCALSICTSQIAIPHLLAQDTPNRPPSAQHRKSQKSNSSTSKKPSEDEHFLMDRVNEARANENLPQLAWDDKLAAAARFHCALMVQNGALSHQYPGEPALQDRASKAGARYNTIAENIATAPDAATIHAEWMHSSGHRANILDHDVTVIGISVLSKDGQLFAVEDFSEAVQNLSLQQQEDSVATLLTSYALQVSPGTDDARRTCAMDRGWSGDSPRSVTRFESANLAELPSSVAAKLGAGKYETAAVGACKSADSGAFTHYRIAILFY